MKRMVVFWYELVTIDEPVITQGVPLSLARLPRYAREAFDEIEAPKLLN
ncbi:MAG: hypothetical protein AB1805_04820 [Nitrospirota bacterium]